MAEMQTFLVLLKEKGGGGNEEAREVAKKSGHPYVEVEYKDVKGSGSPGPQLPLLFAAQLLGGKELFKNPDEFSKALATLLSTASNKTKAKEGEEEGDQYSPLVSEVFKVATDYTMVSSWGYGKDGRLGLGDEKNVPYPCTIGGLGGFSIARIKTGELYQFGSPPGAKMEAKMNLIPIKVELPREGLTFANVFAGFNHAAAVTASGELWMWGKGNFGVLGTGREQDEEMPARLMFDKPVATVACGGHHTLIATRDGALYSMGAPWDGRLGIGDDITASVLSPTLVPFTEGVRQLACGWDHSLVLDKKGKLHSWGKGAYGQLGHGDCESVTTPTLIEDLRTKTIVAIAAGGLFSAAITDTGELYTWGDAKMLQLGHRKGARGGVPFALSPAVAGIRSLPSSPVNNRRDDEDESSGGLVGSRGSMASKKEKAVKHVLVPTPTRVDFFVENGLKVVDLSCGGQHSLVVAVNNRNQRCVYAWGDGTVGALGTGTFAHAELPSYLHYETTPLHIASGLSHSVLIHRPLAVIDVKSLKPPKAVKEDQMIVVAPRKVTLGSHVKSLPRYVVNPDLRFDFSKPGTIFRLARESVMQNLTKPNILVIGQSGSGKSSLINAVFQQTVAAVGVGHAVTQGIVRYAREDLPIVIYDTEGIAFDPVQEKKLVKQLKAIVGTPKSADVNAEELSETSKRRVHAVWFIVDVSSARFTDFDRKVCQDVLPKVPVAFLFNKCDLSTREDIDKMNKVGVYECFTKDSRAPDSHFVELSVCPKCGSEDIAVSLKRRTYECEDCECSGPLPTIANEMRVAIEATLTALPLAVRESFAVAQQLVPKFKQIQSRSILADLHANAADWNPSIRRRAAAPKSKQAVLHEAAQTLVKLALLWSFDKLDDMQRNEAFEGDQAPRWMKTLIDFLEQSKEQDEIEYSATAVAVLWNYCLSHYHHAQINHVDDPIGVAFEAFTPETLKGVAEALRAQGIDEVISQSASLIDSLKAKAHRLYTSSPSSSSSSSTST